MPGPLRLETFRIDQDPAEGPGPAVSEEQEELRLAAYEQGYGAGWDDCMRQAEREALERRAAVERRIEALNFTYHEARGALLSAVEPLLAAIAETVLPAAARAALVPMVIEQLLPLAEGIADTPLTLTVPPASRADFEAALEGLVLPPIEIVESPALDQGQAEIALSSHRARIDLSAVAEGIAASIDRFHHVLERERQHA